MIAGSAPEEPTEVVPATSAAAGAAMMALGGDFTTGEDSSSQAWFDDRLHNFLAAMACDPAGRPRSDVERRALASAARDMIERVGWGAPLPAALPESAVLLPEQLLANTYYVRGLIARGGAGEVYRVRHRDLRTDHAIKILLPRNTLDTIFVTMIMDEARLLQRIRHDGVVACQGLLRDTDGRMMLVMDYVRGRTLSARLQDGPLSHTDLTALIHRLIDALAAIHSHRVIHQDLSPDNIILRDDNCQSATIIDFGLARSLNEPEEMRLLIDFAGKYSWVSPEQLAEPSVTVDVRSDLYSLGLVIAAAATGRRLDMGHDAATARAARRVQPPLDGIGLELASVLRRLLAPNPADRPHTAMDVAALLAPDTRGKSALLSRLFLRQT